MSDSPPSGDATTDRSTTARPASIAASRQALARGFAALRIFFGVIYLSNAIAKVIGVGAYDLGAASFGLLWLPQARFILDDASSTTNFGVLGGLYHSLVLPNFGSSGRFSPSSSWRRAGRCCSVCSAGPRRWATCC